MFKEIFRSNSLRRSKRKKYKEVRWADVGGGDLAKLSYISLDDDTLDLSELETEATEQQPAPTGAPQNDGYRPIPCSKCAKCEKMACNAAFWEQPRAGRVARRKRYNTIGKPADTDGEENNAPDFLSGQKRTRTSGYKFKVSAAAVFLKKIQRGTLGMCVTCGPHMTQ